MRFMYYIITYLSQVGEVLGYQYEDNQLILTLLKLGTHENFYRDIKKEL